MLAGITLTAASQIPSPGFEDWNDLSGILKPDGWQTGAMEESLNVIPSDDAYEGNLSAELLVVYDPVMTSNMSGYMFADGNFPVSERYTALNGYIKGNIIGNDTFSVNVSMWKNGDMIGFGRFKTLDSHNNWTAFSVNITYDSGETPDEGFIAIQLGPIFGGNTGSYYRVDKLELSMTPASIKDDIKETFSIFPNPANNRLQIRFTGRCDVDLVRIIDLTGKTVMEYNTAMQQEIILSAGTLPEGFYFLQTMKENRVTGTEKLIIKH